jgi:hypothetical protein
LAARARIADRVRMPRPRHAGRGLDASGASNRISASARPDIGDRRTGAGDRRASTDRRELPPRPEGRRATGGRREHDPREP